MLISSFSAFAVIAASALLDLHFDASPFQKKRVAAPATRLCFLNTLFQQRTNLIAQRLTLFKMAA
jgi:hypothetical protein